MKKFLLFLFGAVLVSNFAIAGNYTLNNDAVDNLFDSAIEATTSSASNLLSDTFANESMVSLSSGDTTVKVLIAWIVDYFLGGFGIHRYVLGTKGSMWAIYTFTVCGIFGIVPVIDWFVLLIDGLILGNGDKYIDNEKFFMWA
ncbi:MAG: TM2 domain-containing protein [Salinivirgaceae bacterium]|jgi:TM2 domain-containing membrane protein YozV|nr:TM2 domain-containing protein [Salinivirgaceae bacterium]